MQDRKVEFEVTVGGNVIMSQPLYFKKKYTLCFKNEKKSVSILHA